MKKKEYKFEEITVSDLQKFEEIEIDGDRKVVRVIK